MKVMCIKQDNWVNYAGVKDLRINPKYGEECIVMSTQNVDGRGYYFLLGYAPLYLVDNFIPLSEIDETELVKEREQAL